MYPLPDEVINLLDKLGTLYKEYGNIDVEYSHKEDSISVVVDKEGVIGYTMNISSKLIYGESPDDVLELVKGKLDKWSKGNL